MYMFSIKKAALALKENRLSEWQKTQYLLGTFVLSALYATIGSLFPAEFAFSSSERAISYLLSIPVFYFILRSLFHINQKADNQDFISRVTVIGFPAMIQSIVIGWLIYLVIVLLSVVAFPNIDSILMHLAGLAFSPIVYSLYYLKIRQGFYALHT